jgi:hypothetical protein
MSLCLAILATSYLSPYITMWTIATAYQQKNISVLETYIDFSALRQSAREAVTNKMTGSSSLSSPEASSVANYIVNSVINPAGLNTFLAVQNPTRSPLLVSTEVDILDTTLTFNQVHLGYENFDTFVVQIDGQTAMSSTISLVFSRRQFRWVLSGVRF